MRGLALLLVLGLAPFARAEDVLIRGATVLPQEGEVFTGDVLVHDEKIEKVGPHLDAPEGARVISATGLYLVPGLIDVHVHLADRTVFPDLFVPHGVTTVRDMGNVLAEVKELASDRSPWRPEILYVGPILDGRPPIWPTISEVLEDPEKVAPVLARLKEQGCGWFKVYENLTPAVYDAIIKEAKKLGVPVIGHVPTAVGLLHCVESGQDTIEHLDHFAPSLMDPEGSMGFAAELDSWTKIDPAKEKKLIEALVKSKTRLDPTFIVIRNYSKILRGLKPDPAGARLVPESVKDMFWMARADTKRATEETDKAHEASHARALEFVKKASEAGVSILCGTDVANPYVVPGASVHEEIEELAKALGPEKALACATIENARALGRDDLGRIKKGARADLVLLAKDPRSDAHAVRSIEAVLVRGRLHDKKALEKQLAKLEEHAKKADAAAITGFESIDGPLSDKNPLGPEWRFEGRFEQFAPSYWLRARMFEAPESGKLTVLRAAASMPTPSRVKEELQKDKDGRLVRFEIALEAQDKRSATVEREGKSWRVKIAKEGEKETSVVLAEDELPQTRGELLTLDLFASLDLKEGEKTTKKLRFIDLDRATVQDAVEWTIRRKKNPVTDAKDPRSSGRYLVAKSEDPNAPSLSAWLGEKGEPLGFGFELPYGKFVLGRVEAPKKKYY